MTELCALHRVGERNLAADKVIGHGSGLTFERITRIADPELTTEVGTVDGSGRLLHDMASSCAINRLPSWVSGWYVPDRNTMSFPVVKACAFRPRAR
jgi:hypothetical protein